MMGTVWSHTPTRSREVAGFHTQDRKDQAITERSLRSSYAPAACGLPRGPCGRFQEEGGSGTGWQASCHAARLRPWARSSAPPTLTTQAPSHSLQSSSDTASQGRPVPPGLSPCASLPWILGFGTPQPHAHKHLYPSSSPSPTALTNPFNYFLSERRSCMLLENNQINGFYFKP